MKSRGDATISDSLFQGNSTDNYAGAMEVGGNLTLTNTRFINNTADTYGGALAFSSDDVIANSLFQGNRATDSGGAISGGSSLTVSNTRFISNSAGADGGAITNGDVKVTNSLFAGNTAGSGKGVALNLSSGSHILQYTTIASGTMGSGSAIVVASGGTLGITNSIIGNYTTGIGSSGTVNEDYTLFAGVTTPVDGGSAGTHSWVSSNFSAAGFVDAAGGDFHLTSSSWAINKGMDAGIATDYEGDARPGGGYDLGYDETTYTGPTAVDDTATTTMDKALTLSPLTNDIKTDSDDLTIGVVGSPAHGTATISGDSQLVFTPTTGYSGTVVFTYTAREASQLEDTATITVTVDEISDIFLPLIVKNYRPLPDLVITALSGDSSGISLTIQNIGDKTVVNDFWVDVYFNPDKEPELNDRWDSIGSDAGAAWGVTADLAPGDTLNLTSGGAYYRTDLSSSSFPDGATVYGLVDSVNHNTTYGNVEERNEANNLWSSTGPVSLPAAGGSGASTPGLPGR